jgi:hypothetical protein
MADDAIFMLNIADALPDHRAWRWEFRVIKR